MVRVLARVGGKHCSLVPLFVLLIGAGGQLLPYASAEPVIMAAVAPVSAELLQIDAVLARKAPELGIALRQRVAEAIVEEARVARLDPLFVLGLIEVESEFDGTAVSTAGARGLMQLRPVTAEYLAGLEGLRLTVSDIYRDPALQVRLAVRYLSRLERRFGNLDLALMAYNAGPEKLKSALEQGDTDRWRNYARAVRRNYERFRRGAQISGDATLAQADPPETDPEPALDGPDRAALP